MAAGAGAAAGPPLLMLLTDLTEPAVAAATRDGLLLFGATLCLSAGGGGSGAGNAAAPPPRPLLGLCCLLRPPGAAKPVLSVRCRPGPFSLREFAAGVGRLAAAERGVDGKDAAVAAAALQQLVGVVAGDPACAAAATKTVLLLTDRTASEPSEWFPCLETCKAKGVRVELVLMDAGGGGGGGPPDGSTHLAGASTHLEAMAAAWGAAEAAFPHLSVTLVPHASKLSLAALASNLLQRAARTQPLPVSLQFRVPLVGSLRALPLACCAEVRPLAQGVGHAPLCPCHRTPASWAPGGAAAMCAVTGAPLDRRQCGRDERTVQVGLGACGALHLAAPFDIAAVAGAAGGGPATLAVLSRVKADQANPALLFGLPLMLATAPGGQAVRVAHEGELASVTPAALLAVVCESLRSSGEALLCQSTTDLESGAVGLLRLHYLVLPCEGGAGRPPSLCARRVACAEELLAPLMPAGAEAADGSEGGAAALPPAVAAAVAGQLAAVPLAEALDPLALSSRCVEIVETLVRESQPLPKPALPPAAAPGNSAAPAAAHAAPAPAPAQPAAAAAPAAKGRRPQAGGGAARESGVRAAGGGKGGLDLKRSGRR
ncbi:hypothetical protein C2E20_8288 [Micractinium conductrix]|uniref:Uncharacterized protein n=1 Tax=Micractinium conductrix TaxID=554055 RepID=A0A2P6V210_9CHLO|nr:hypothetical protein C2E20_8288 [Micractinium conductrix]|eukprot:PSC68125.1 hypothetical protein C2E20_8288 [Micractinium conductrix]